MYLNYFKKICSIPHGSYNVKQLADFCQQEAKKFNLDCIRDDEDNLIITVPASKGFESAPAVILQGHLDMVCVSAPGHVHNFKTDGLELIEDGDNLSANGTSLGGDDGIAIAYMLNLMADKTLNHPKLYLLMTTNEEVGMDGAFALDPEPIKDAKYLINIDSEEEGIFTAGCAGGVTALAQWSIKYRKARGLNCSITLENLLGGHSGSEINRFGANAHVLLGNILYQLSKELPINLIGLSGGDKDNVIPHRAVACVQIGTTDFGLLESKLAKLETSYRKNYQETDPNLTLTAHAYEEQEDQVLIKDDFNKICFILNQIPNGVITMSQKIENLPRTSLNAGVMRLDMDTFSLGFQIRSENQQAKEMLSDRLEQFAIYTNGTYNISGTYPSWEYNENSPLRKLMLDLYQKMYHKPAIVNVIHAGLECGLLSEKLPNIDMISIGPNMKNVHTPDETLSLSSSESVWQFLCAVLEHLGQN